jgi:arabinosaccharide transport system substrate-binding protein
MGFHLGKPILALLAVAACAGIWLAARPTPPEADLKLWTFADSHADAYRSLAPEFQRQTGRTVEVQLLPPMALNTRLVSMFMAGPGTRGLPDAVELQMSTAGPYFRAPAEEMGLLPLDGYLANWRGRILPARLAAWTHDGHVFGIPHDVHPVAIAYREDLFREAGVDLAAATTWREFHTFCLQYQQFARNHWAGDRFAMELFNSNADELNLLCLQRGVNLIDESMQVRLTDPRVVETVALYARMVAGPERIGIDGGTGAGGWVDDLVSGRVAASFMPDWRVNDLRRRGGTIAGKLRMIPLPRFDPADPPTSTWDGTMIGIPRGVRDRDAAWKLIETMYLSDASLETRYRQTDIIPPVRDVWDRPFLHQPDPFFGEQKVGELYVQLAGQVPARRLTWASPLATQALGYVLHQVKGYISSGKPRGGLKAYTASCLADAQAYLERTIREAGYPVAERGAAP